MLTIKGKERRGHSVIFYLEGTIRLEDISHLRKAFWESMNEEGVQELIINLEGVKSVDPTGISLFISTKNSISKINGRLVLVGLPKSMMAVLERTNLLHYFELRGDVKDAMRRRKKYHSRHRRRQD